MGTSKRFWALCVASAAALVAAAPGCNDNDSTEVCVGPDCPQYDGVGGERNFFRSADPENIDTAGSAGASGEAGMAGSAGSGGEPPDVESPDATTPPPDGSTPPACQIAFTSPALGDAGDLTVDGTRDADGEACGSQFVLPVALTSNAKSVTLFVNDAPLSTQDLVDGAISFDAVLGNRGSTPNVLRAEATMADNSTCSVTFSSNILVDCAGPSCSITAPANNADGYLNDTQDIDGASGFQTDIVVGTEAEQVGQNVRLEIDGAFGTVPDAQVLVDSNSGSATFGNVTLAEGSRTVRAECSDAFGLKTLSAPAAFDVDVTPCTISISSIAGNANPITPSNDQDPGTPGIQALANGTITGGDCKTLWIGVCNGALTPLPLTVPQDGSFSLPVTLTGSSGSLDICGAVEDLAGNFSSQDQVTVNLRLNAPQVAIVSPAPNTRFNQLGTSGAVADGDALTPGTCEAAVVVNCTELGQNVDLLADGSPIAQATCLAQGSLPSPFVGQATFAQASLPTKNDGNLTGLSVQQTANGMTSVASSINVQADCQVPVPSITAPGCGTQLAIPEDDADLGTSGQQRDVVVANDGASDTTITITRGVATSSASTTGDATTTTFPALDLGGPGSIDLVACVTDPQGNQGCTASCALTITDHPSLSITSPADQSALVNSTPDCNAGAAGLDVTVQGTSNAANGSQVQLHLGVGALATTTVVSGFYSSCVAAPQGLDQNLTVTVTDGTTGLVTSTSVQVDVDSNAPVTPIAAPSFAIVGRRQGTVRLTWNPVNDAVGATMRAYQLRCAATDITSEGTWNSATVVPITTVPTAAGSPQNDVFGGFRTGTSRFCVLRGENLDGQLTPIAAGQSVTVTNPFATAPYDTVATASTTRVSVAAIGDVSGDGEDDFIVGSEDNGAQVFFGGSALDTTPEITITGGAAGARFGSVVAGLGDINGDGRPDFAVGAPTLANGGTNTGSVFIFFGRDAGNPWPTPPTPITVAANPGCGADICFHGTNGLAQFGTPIASTNFDGVGPMDLVIGAQNNNTRVGRVYVILGGAQLSVPTGTVFTLPGSTLDGFIVDPPTTNSFFGSGVTAVGSGTDAFGDLVVSAVGRSTGSVPGAAYFLAGQAHPGAGAGFVSPTGGTLTLFASGNPSQFGGSVAGIGDFNGDGFNDVCVSHDFAAVNGGGNCNVYLGQANGFAGSSSVLNYANNAVDNDWGFYTAPGFNPGLGAIDPTLLLLGDLDRDGRGELALGSQAVVGAPGTAELFYGDVGVTARIRADADMHLLSANQGHMAPAFVGDIDGDGFNDMAVLDTDAGTASRLTLLY